MADETLRLANTLVQVTKRASKDARFIGTSGEVNRIAAAYIDIHERMRKIAREAIAASQSIERGEVPLQKLCLILALTKGPTK